MAAGTTATAGVLAATAGWSSPTGLAAFLTALVGAGAFIWSVVSATRKRRQIDVDAAVEIIEALKKRDADEAK
jgi:hypothetical protein